MRCRRLVGQQIKQVEAELRTTDGVRPAFAFAVVGSLAHLLLAAVGARADAPPLARADLHYSQHSYAAALKEYASALKAGSVPAGRLDEVGDRIAVSLGKTHQWDRAMAASLDFARKHQGTVWEARGLYHLGLLYLSLPHTGYRVGAVVNRGDNVPKSTKIDRPIRVAFGEQDQRDAREALEAAHVFYARVHSPSAMHEKILLDYDLAQLLYADPQFNLWQSGKKWAAPGDLTLAIQSGEAYSTEWAPPKKVLSLYADIRTLGGPTAHSTAESLLAEAFWLQHYQANMRRFAIRYENEKPVPIRFPYDKWSPIERLQRIIREFPNDPLHDQARFLVGSLLEADGKLTAATTEYRGLIGERPKSKWATDCRSRLQELAHRGLSFSTPSVYFPGMPAVIELGSRNISAVRLQLYRISLEQWIGQSPRLSDPAFSLTDASSIVGSLQKLPARLGKPISEWTTQIVDRGDYQRHNTRVTIPFQGSGTYILIGSAPGIRSVNLLTKTGIVLVQRCERDRTLLYAADAQTGRPKPQTHVMARETYFEQNGNGQQAPRVSIVRGITGADGTASLQILHGGTRSNFQVSAFAWRGSDYALTEQSYSPDGTDDRSRFLTYSTTDRAVYRPLQTVQFREVVMERQTAGMKPVIGKTVHIEVFDPRARRIYASLIKSSEFGSVNGHFSLPPDSPLGEYAVRCSLFKVENGETDAGGSQFRVEEYKKPEFQVTVLPDAERVRLGQPTSARVQAKYYSGGPAVGAAVSYRVYRSTYTQSYRFPKPFDFLYNDAGQGRYDNSYRNGDVIAQGKSRTDAKGEAKISFPTRADGGRWQDQDLSYTVEADVRDSSRRTITGTGAVKATRHDVGVFLNYPRGYAHKNDHVPVEIITLNASDVPISTEGLAKVYRRAADPTAKEKLVYQKRLATDSHGRVILDWTADTAGYFRIAFTTHDTAGLEVEGSTDVLVQGVELTRGGFLSQGVALSVESPYYQEGDTARLLILTQTADCTVLLTREANNQILEKRLVRMAGRSAEVSIPLQHRDVPNVFITATMVRNGQIFEATRELFVPPVRQLAKLTVRADKDKYQPGEKAKLALAATDWQGHPLRAELAVSISDAALAYIQKDYAQDIRVYYYGDRRSQSTGSSGSTSAEFQEVVQDTQHRTNYQNHEVMLSVGMIPEWGIGDTVHIARNAYDYDGHGDTGLTPGRPIAMASFRTMSREGVQLNFGLTAGGAVNGDLYDRQDNASGANHSFAAGKAAPPAAMGGMGSFGGGHGFATQQPQVRRQFLDTAFWTPAVVTDARGMATVDVTWPDNLTEWRAVTVGNSGEAQVGTAETSVTVRKDLLVRLETPRYFVERDTMVVSALVQNGTASDAHVQVKLNMDTDKLEILSSGPDGPAADARPEKAQTREVWVDVPRDGEQRVDWRVHVLHPGSVRLAASALSDNGSDAAEAVVPVLVHGVERALATSGALRGGSGVATVPITLSEARKPGMSEVVVQVNPSLAAVMLDALPYLNDYPYGCIEQTMSRFLPSILTARVLKEQGLKLEDLRKRAIALKKQAQAGRGAAHVEDSPYTYPSGKPGVEIAPIDRTENPVFDSKTLNKMIAAGMERIRDYQHADGGWGWWKDDASDTWMTAYVVYGLIQARQAGTTVDAAMARRAEAFLMKRIQIHEDQDLHRLAFVTRVLALMPENRAAIRPICTGRLYAGREKLSAYSKALLALALSSLGEKARAEVMLGNLESTVQVDETEGTAHWGDVRNFWWRWYNDQVETNAAVLQAYLAVQPGSHLAPMIVKWLVNHRQGDNWSSTRETALTVYALSDYIRANRELSPNYDLTLDLGGRIKRSYHVTPQNALLFDNRFVVPDSLLETGSQAVTISKQGSGTCYYNVYTRYFSQEEPIPASGNGIYVTRKYFRLLAGTASGAPVPTDVDFNRSNPFIAGHYDLLTELGSDVDEGDTDAGPRYQRVAMEPGETITSGDQIEVELSLEAKNDYDYLAFEDMKPAGCEPVEVRSGEKAGQGVYSNFELRDQKVVFFLSNITQGTRTLSYRLRAEAPGNFHVLPTNGYAMYAPSLRTLSAERTIEIRDEEPGGHR